MILTMERTFLECLQYYPAHCGRHHGVNRKRGLNVGVILFVIYVVLGIVLTVISTFIGNIIFFDSILLAVLSGVLCHTLWTVHPAFCLLIGAAVFLLLFWLQYTSVGFWIIGGMMSLLWSAVFGVLAYFMSENDAIWGWVVFGLAAVIMTILHFKARDIDI